MGRLEAPILDKNPELAVNVGFSLDGLVATHDRVHGVPGCFGKALASLKAVSARRQREKVL